MHEFPAYTFVNILVLNVFLQKSLQESKQLKKLRGGLHLFHIKVISSSKGLRCFQVESEPAAVMRVNVTWGSLRSEATPPPPRELLRTKLRAWIPGREYLQNKERAKRKSA